LIIFRDEARESRDFMKQKFRERECIHREEGVEGEFFNGVSYVQALQQLPIDRAMQIAGKVGSFFWVDAPHILVWLCAACSTDLELEDTPRAIAKAARRQA
jgi:hypothetical protein